MLVVNKGSPGCCPHPTLWLSPSSPTEAGTVLVCHRGCWLLHQPQTGFEDGPLGQVSRDLQAGGGGRGVQRGGIGWCVGGVFVAESA